MQIKTAVSVWPTVSVKAVVLISHSGTYPLSFRISCLYLNTPIADIYRCTSVLTFFGTFLLEFSSYKPAAQCIVDFVTH
jgi:hypothetical protein